MFNFIWRSGPLRRRFEKRVKGSGAMPELQSCSSLLRTWLYLVIYRFQSFRTPRGMSHTNVANVACHSVESRSCLLSGLVLDPSNKRRLGLLDLSKRTRQNNSWAVNSFPVAPDPDLNHFEWVYTGFFELRIITRKSLLWLLSFEYPWNLGRSCLRWINAAWTLYGYRVTLTSVLLSNSRELGIISMGLRSVQIEIGESFILTRHGDRLAT